MISDAGGQVDVMYLTNGDSGFFPGARPTAAEREKLGKRRQEEALEACHVLGAHDVTFLNCPDGMVNEHPELGESILEALRIGGYRSVFCPWAGDSHQDHAAAFQILRQVLSALSRPIDVWQYEVWTPMKPNICIAIDATIDAKIEAVRAHKTQTALLNYVDAARGLAQYRSLTRPPARYAEAFYQCDGITIVRDEDQPWLRPKNAAL